MFVDFDDTHRCLLVFLFDCLLGFSGCDLDSLQILLLLAHP